MKFELLMAQLISATSISFAFLDHGALSFTEKTDINYKEIFFESTNIEYKFFLKVHFIVIRPLGRVMTLPTKLLFIERFTALFLHCE